ncbi:hypothetical protein ACHAXR_009824 [Thalassiosira sp. AJA248-18]
MHSSRSSLQHHSLSSDRNSPPKKTATALNLQKSVEDAIAEANKICHYEGAGSRRCQVAWDIVEELEAADSHVRTPEAVPTELDYAPLVNGLDILTDKIDRKMDELRNLSSQLVESGAGVPEVERLIYASDEMKQVLAEAKAAMAQYR